MEVQEQVIPKSLEKVQNEEFTLQKVQTLFFLSYRFSQGNANLQKEIFEYLHFLHPTWRMSDEFKEQLKTKVSPLIENYIMRESNRPGIHTVDTAGGGYIGKEAVGKSIGIETDAMRDVFNKEEVNKPDMQLLASHVIDKDFKFLCERNGRERNLKSNNGSYTPESDAFLSHTIYYGLEGNSTKVEEYDRMFEEVKEEVLTYLPRRRFFKLLERKSNGEFKGEFKKKLFAVVDKYAQTHPNSIAKLKSLGFLRANAT